jgi:predicted transcriptional regulator of viral defense system
MQPQKQLEKVLASLVDADHYLFSSSDLQGVFGRSKGLLVLLSRAEKAGILKRVCRGVYL